MSSRLGFPKAMLRLGTGRTVLEDIVGKLLRLSDDVLVIAGREELTVRGARRIPDLIPGAAALGGIYTALASARHDRVIVVGCDMPFLSIDALVRLTQMSGDVVVPRNPDGFAEPLHAVYSRVCLEAVESRVRDGRLKIAGFFEAVDVTYVDDVDPRSYRNVNTAAALRDVLERVEREGLATLQ